MDDSRNRRSEALHYCKRQAEKVAFRHGGYGRYSSGAGGPYDGFYSLRKGETMKFKTLGNRNAPAVLFFHARVGDGMMKMQIVKIGFGGKQ